MKCLIFITILSCSTYNCGALRFANIITAVRQLSDSLPNAANNFNDAAKSAESTVAAMSRAGFGVRQSIKEASESLRMG